MGTMLGGVTGITGGDSLLAKYGINQMRWLFLGAVSLKVG